MNFLKWRLCLLLFASIGAWVVLMPDVAIGQSTVYQTNIDRYKAQDALNPMPEDALLFVGSSSVRFWEGLAEDFVDYRVIQRGFGGSAIADLQIFGGNISSSNVVQTYSPRAIIVWSGTNDINSGGNATTVLAGFQNFVSRVQGDLPSVQIFYLGLIKNPLFTSNSSLNAERLLLNQELSAWVAGSGNPRLHYIDLPQLFENLGNNGTPTLASYFVDDRHLNRDGYALWTAKIQSDLAAQGILPDKSYQPNPLSPLPGKTVLFDFGPSDSANGNQTLGSDSNGNQWNNWHSATGSVSPQAGEHIGGLKDSTGADTGIKLTLTGPFTLGRNASEIPLTQNTTTLGALATPSASQDFFKWSGLYPAGFYLSGLDPLRSYELRFFGSKNGTTTQTTRFAASGNNTVTATLTTSGAGIGDGGVNHNTRHLAILPEIAPNRYGEIQIDLSAIQGSECHLNAMQLQVLSKIPTSISSTPVASPIVFGQRLSNSTLTGGAATANGSSIAGTFSFSDPDLIPPVGHSTQRVVFTPADSGNFTTLGVNITVSVAPGAVPPDKVLIDFGSSNSANGAYPTASAFANGPDSNGNYWNNFSTDNGTISNLVFTDNSTTGITLSGTNALTGAASGGWGIANGTVNMANANLNIFTAYTDGLYVFSGNTTLTFSGLDPAKRYSLELFASRSAGNATVTNNRTTLFTVSSANGSSTRTLLTSGHNSGADGRNYNTSNTVLFENLEPDPSNRIVLRFEGHNGQTSGSYLNAVQITATSLNPEISVEHPAGTFLASPGGAVSFGGMPVGENSVAKTFVVANRGASPLESLALSKSGSAAADFTLGTLSSNSIAAQGSGTFTVHFTPTTAGNRTAQILIASNDPDNNPFIIPLSGIGLSAALDSDGDGLNDVAEYRFSSLGFDWQVPNPGLVDTLLTHAETAGFYSADQMQTLALGLPVLSRNATTGGFTLKLRLEKSTDLQSFHPMPFTEESTYVNPSTGEIELDFSPSGNAAFFRVRAK